MKAEILKILEMSKSGAISDEQAAALIEELKPAKQAGLASMIHETIHAAMDHVKEHHHHHGKHHHWHHSHVRTPRGSEMEFEGNEIHMAKVDDIELTRSKMNANKIDAAKVQDLSLKDAAFTDSRISASAVEDVHVWNSEVRACGILCSKIQDVAITERSLFENVEINAFLMKDVAFDETVMRDVVIFGGDVGWFKKSCFKDARFIGSEFKKVVFKGCRIQDAVIKNVHIENMTIEGVSLTDCVIDGTEAFLAAVKGGAK